MPNSANLFFAIAFPVNTSLEKLYDVIVKITKNEQNNEHMLEFNKKSFQTYRKTWKYTTLMNMLHEILDWAIKRENNIFHVI